MKKAEPVYSAGARYERQAFREYLKRKINEGGPGSSVTFAYSFVLDWVRKRQARYDKRAGGL